MYEEFVGKRVQITTLVNGKQVKWPVRKLLEIEGGLLLLDSGEEVDTESEDFVGLIPEPPSPRLKT